MIAIVFGREPASARKVAHLRSGFGFSHEGVFREGALMPRRAHACEGGHRFLRATEAAERAAEREGGEWSTLVARVLADHALQVRKRLRWMIGQARDVGRHEQLLDRV